MPTNFYMFFVAGLIPLVIGSVYYSKNVLGGIWQRENGLTDEDLQKGNIAVIFGITYVLSVIAAFFLSSLVIHQGAIVSLLFPESLEAGSAAQQEINEFMAKYGDRHRGFSHGMAHGSFVTLFFILPIIAINALFERKSWKYILIHAGYWWISLMLMGGLLCQTLEYAPLG
ncbi:MAG: DUF1761 domain-containing protein [Bacteroidota bacterium]